MIYCNSIHFPRAKNSSKKHWLILSLLIERFFVLFSLAPFGGIPISIEILQDRTEKRNLEYFTTLTQLFPEAWLWDFGKIKSFKHFSSKRFYTSFLSCVLFHLQPLILPEYHLIQEYPSQISFEMGKLLDVLSLTYHELGRKECWGPRVNR